PPWFHQPWLTCRWPAAPDAKRPAKHPIPLPIPPTAIPSVFWTSALLLFHFMKLVLFRCAVAGFLRVGFRHVLALFGLAVPACARLVVDAGIGVNPNHAVAVGWRSLLLRAGGRFARSRRSGRVGWSGRGCRRGFGCRSGRSRCARRSWRGAGGGVSRLL